MEGTQSRLSSRSFYQEGSVPRSSRHFRDERAAQPSRPLRFDLNHSSSSCGVVIETAPSILPGRLDQSALDWIPVNVSDHFGPGRISADVSVEVTFLPKLLAIASQFAGRGLLE